MSSSANEKEKVAILGGGMGGLTTALELTSPQNPNRHKYDITVYQQGWRLGGKGASGRNRDESDRIEEHGLHVWLGFYENAFRLIREVFEEWEIPEGHPWGGGPREDRWKRAFKGGDFAPLTEPFIKSNGEEDWKIWPIRFPRRSGEPGDGDWHFSIWTAITCLRNWLNDLLELIDIDGENDRVDENLKEVFSRGQDFDTIRGQRSPPRKADQTIQFMDDVGGFVSNSDHEHPSRWRCFLMAFRSRRNWKRLQVERKVDDTTFFFILLDLGFAVLTGLIFNLVKLLKKGFDSLDQVDFRSWLRKYGARPSSVESPLVDALYDAAFAARRGVNEDMAAGAALRSLLRISFDYKGHSYWRMQAGMGDTIFTPVYEVLKQRGVKFKFFHRVTEIKATVDRRVSRIEFARQADLISGQSEYSPLVGVSYREEATGDNFPEKLQCWPSEIHYNQIEQGPILRELKTSRGIDLENPSYAEFYEDPGGFTLIDRKDFTPADDSSGLEPVDRIVLAIPIAALPGICPDLIRIHRPFRRMVESVQTVRTAASQIWLKEETGFPYHPEMVPLFGNFRNPLKTWGDVTHLNHAEPFQQEPKQVGYFCGPMPDDIPEDEAAEYVETESFATWDELARTFWPNTNDGSGKLDRNLVMSTYFRANTFPSERYTLSVAGSTKHRLYANESGFDNLTLAGDWTRNGFNVGCIEATVMSGMQASNAISGHPALSDIVGNNGP